jgi:hypothetical protein
VTGDDWALAAAAIVYLALLVVLLRERTALRRQVHRAEAQVAHLEIEVQSTRADLATLRGYLSRSSAWSVGDGDRRVDG